MQDPLTKEMVASPTYTYHYPTVVWSDDPAAAMVEDDSGRSTEGVAKRGDAALLYYTTLAANVVDPLEWRVIQAPSTMVKDPRTGYTYRIMKTYRNPLRSDGDPQVINLELIKGGPDV